MERKLAELYLTPMERDILLTLIMYSCVVYANSNLKISLTVAVIYVLWHKILKMHNLWSYLTLFLFLLFQLKEADSMLHPVPFF